MAKSHTLIEHLQSFASGTAQDCCETEILATVGIVLLVMAIGAICAPFLNQTPIGD